MNATQFRFLVRIPHPSSLSSRRLA